jgi:UDP-N-acetylglucosamine:LPS N-acetylglucosamine transferase
MANVLIISSRTGGGHQSAACALQDGFGTLSGTVLVRILQVLEDGSWLTSKLVDFYNYLLRHKQHYMKYYYWWINFFKPNESLMILAPAFRKGRQWLERYAPDMIVSVHPMTHHFFSYVLKRLGLTEKVPMVAVVTDPCGGFWKGWACNGVQHYYVATQAACQQLMDYDVAENRITVVGMPVHPKFKPVSDDAKLQLRKALGLKPELFTVLVNAGWVGGGNITRLLQALCDERELLPIQVIYLCGKNRPLAREGKKIALKALFPVKVMSHCNDMEQLMQASDVMVSKLGGLTTFEALACHLPILADTLTEPMPQEAETAGFLKSTGTGLLLKEPEDLALHLKTLLAHPEYWQAMRAAAAHHHPANATHAIVNAILERMAG